MMSDFENRVKDFVDERQSKMVGTINAMLDFKLEGFKENEEICLSFPVSAWQLNPMGHMHGGMICTAFDITMGCLSYACNGGHPNPTVDLQVRFIRGVREGDTLYIRARVLYAGSRIIQVEAHAYLKDKTTWAAQASASYIVNNCISHKNIQK